MLALDPDSRAVLRLHLNRLIDEHTKALPSGEYYDSNGSFRIGIFEFNRGIIEGLKEALSLLDPTSTETHSEENDEQSAA